MSATVEVLVLRPLLYLGRRREAAEVLSVPPADAWQLCSGGRAEMHDARRDGAAVHAAVTADNVRALKADGNGWQQPAADGPWRQR